MAEIHGIGKDDNAHRHSRRVILGAVAAVGVLAPGASAARAANSGERQSDRPAGALTGTEQANARPATVVESPGAAEVWGTSRSGHGAGVRGNGRWGVVGEGTHTGVEADGFIGVRGTTSIVQGEQRGVAVWAHAATPGSTALRADGPSEFNGATTFSRSGVVSVPRGSASLTVTDVPITAGTAILATLQNRVKGLYLHAVETDVARGSFTIFLSTVTDRDVRIAWFALG